MRNPLVTLCRRQPLRRRPRQGPNQRRLLLENVLALVDIREFYRIQPRGPLRSNRQYCSATREMAFLEEQELLTPQESPADEAGDPDAFPLRPDLRGYLQRRSSVSRGQS